MKLTFFEFDATQDFIPPGKIDPPYNYQPHESDELSKKFPLCCDFHMESFHWLDERYKSGTWISNEDKQRYKSWFKKEIYDGMPMKIVQQVSYTEFIISEKLNTNNWYKVIRDYIDSNVHSFGYPDLFSRAYLVFLQHYIERVAHFPDKKKKNQLLQYIDRKIQGPGTIENKERPVEFEVVQDTIRKWVKFFPFELDKFKGLKEFFVNQGIIITEVSEPNEFDNSLKIKTITESELSGLLMATTTNLLGDIDQMKLINDLDEKSFRDHSLKIQIKSHFASQQKLLSENNFPDYLNLIEKWLNNEEIFLNKVKNEVNFKNNRKTFHTNYSDIQLDKLRKRMIDQPFIKPINQENFSYIFQSLPVNKIKSKIKWASSLLKAHYFFREYIFKNKDMDYNLINDCFKFSEGKKLDSNHKYKEYIEIDNLFKDL